MYIRLWYQLFIESQQPNSPAGTDPNPGFNMRLKLKYPDTWSAF